MNKLFLDIGPGKAKEAWDHAGQFKIIGIEPCDVIYEKMRNNFPGILIHAAIADKPGIVEGWESGGGFEFFLEPRDEIPPYFKKMWKCAITLDCLYDQLGEQFNEIRLWADIEGGELLMLKGADRLLRSGKLTWIRVEVREIPPAVEGWCSAKDVYEFLEAYNFVARIPLYKIKGERYRNIIFEPKEIVCSKSTG